ncbi:Baseplate J family protein (fragment) [uncultured delta proteobacterium]|uniref:Baseplate J family protein n=1 Tax=uncultured delta proteobacterium TaxID=34034 RepID=A0A212JYZ3_9DELT
MLSPVTGDPGRAVPAGMAYTRKDGLEYTADLGATIGDDGTAQLSLTCTEPGKNGNADGPCKLQLSEPLTGVQSEAIVIDGFSGGTDGESEGTYRSRVLSRKRKPGRGGNDDDYEFWTLECAGFTRAWPRRDLMGAGTVVVYAMMDGTYEDGIPREGDIARLQAHLNKRRPVPAEVYAFAPTPKRLDTRLAVTPDTPAVRAAVTASIAAAVRRDAEPGTAIMLSRLNEAISIAAGEEDHVLFSPTANVLHATGEIAVPGTVTFGEANNG